MSKNFFGIRIKKNSSESTTFAIEVETSVSQLLYSIYSNLDYTFNKSGSSTNFFDKKSMNYYFKRAVKYIDLADPENFEYLDKKKAAIEKIIGGDLSAFKPPTIRKNRVYNFYGDVFMPYNNSILTNDLDSGIILDVDKISLEVYNKKYNDDLYSMYNIPKVCSLNIKSFAFFVNTAGLSVLVSNDFLFNRMREQELKLQKMRGKNE